MPVLAIIPARAGSKRLPGKNMRLLGSKPLVAWAIEAARQAMAIDTLVVSSDDEHVLELAASYDPALPLRRPAALATDTAKAIGYVQHALEQVAHPHEQPFDTVVILQPTTPFVAPADIDGTIALLEESGADSAVSVVELDQIIHPFKLKVLDGTRLLPYWEPEEGRMDRHEIPTLYARNGAVYASRRAVIEGGAVIGTDCRGYVMPAERSVDINTALDWQFAAFLLHQRTG